MGGSVGYFGEHGQLVVTGDLKFNVERESRSMGGGTATTYAIQPALDYFVSSNVSVGGLIGLSREVSSETDLHLTTLLIGARIGYQVPIGNAASLWLRGGFSYEHQSFTAGGVDTSGYAVPLNIYAVFLWHPVAHFFIGAGPFLNQDLIAKFEGSDVGKRTDLGISSTIGGYFGGL